MFKKNISINPANPKIKNKKINFEDDNIKPILAYSVFTAKYILKKKSTILMPICSFILVLLLSIIPVFLGDVLVHTIFLLVTSSITISVTAVFATIKALNLFKDISSEGMEIIIVSKPIRRSQIIFVRFVFFFLLGVIICLLNYFAILIGLLSYYGVSNPSFPIFNYITIFFFSMLVAYIFFGSLSILLSLKFSTKLVSSFSLGFLSMGTVFSQVLPQVIPLMEKNLEQRISEISDYSLTLRYKVTTDGKVILYTKDFMTPLTPEEVEIINTAFETQVDYS
jgi:ABC-type transport system involved in multi-copper enzyme maturation permease subunit